MVRVGSEAAREKGIIFSNVCWEYMLINSVRVCGEICKKSWMLSFCTNICSKQEEKQVSSGEMHNEFNASANVHLIREPFRKMW